MKDELKELKVESERAGEISQDIESFLKTLFRWFDCITFTFVNSTLFSYEARGWAEAEPQPPSGWAID